MANDNWGTPPKIFLPQNALYHFTIDAAADTSNHLLPRWFGPGGEREDALSEAPWPAGEVYWCNPPYSKGMQKRFVLKAMEAAGEGSTVVMLLPADTSTKLFHEYITHLPHDFLRGRIKFVGADQGAKFGSMFVYFFPW